MKRMLLTLGLTAALSGPALAAACGNTGEGFNAWLQDFRSDMQAKGYTDKSLKALDGLKYSTRVIKLDRGQKSFKQSFDTFYKRRSNGVVRIAKKKLKKHARTMALVEKKYGVPKEILLTVWGLETGFGSFNGNKPIFQSLATLAYDCRRSKFFTDELVAALTIAQKGQIPLSQMKGAWAGEIGQTQFLATRYVNYGVSFDGDRQVDLYRSVPDV